MALNWLFSSSGWCTSFTHQIVANCSVSCLNRWRSVLTDSFCGNKPTERFDTAIVSRSSAALSKNHCQGLDNLPCPSPLHESPLVICGSLTLKILTPCSSSCLSRCPVLISSSCFHSMNLPRCTICPNLTCSVFCSLTSKFYDVLLPGQFFLLRVLFNFSSFLIGILRSDSFPLCSEFLIKTLWRIEDTSCWATVLQSLSFSLGSRLYGMTLTFSLTVTDAMAAAHSGSSLVTSLQQSTQHPHHLWYDLHRFIQQWEAVYVNTREFLLDQVRA